MNTTSSTACSTASATNRNRCQHRTASGRQCRSIPASGSRSAFCRRHSQSSHRDQDFSAQLLCRSGSLRTPADINAALAATFKLLAEGRISPRRASSLAYITCLIMNNDFTAPTRDHYTFQDVFAAIRADHQCRTQESATKPAAVSSRSAYPPAPASASPASPSTKARPAVPSATAAPMHARASAPVSAPPVTATSTSHVASSIASTVLVANAAATPAVPPAAPTPASTAQPSKSSASPQSSEAPSAPPLASRDSANSTPFDNQGLGRINLPPTFLVFEERHQEHLRARRAASRPPSAPTAPTP